MGHPRSAAPAALLAGGLLLAATPIPAGEIPTVAVLLFDGFAPSLVEAFPTPALDRMAEEGAWTHRLAPAFPTVSLVNGFTLTTGCWPAGHGIVHNRFLDPERGFYDHSRDADWLTGCELLHAVAERQGVTAAALGWYGAVSASRGPLATIAEPVGDRAEYPQDGERARDVVELLGRPAGERPRLILAYLPGPDGAAHFGGIASEEARRAVRRADAAVERVLRAADGLAARGEAVAVLVTTDHGMRPVSHLINVERILRWHGIAGRVTAAGTVAFVYLDDPETGPAARRALARYREFQVFAKGATPPWSRLGSEPRVGDLILSARPPYFIEDSGRWPWWARPLAALGPRFLPAAGFFRASHGYPPSAPEMAGILYARGAGIARGKRLREMRAVDLHPTVARLLGIGPGRPVDGRIVGELLAR